MARKPATVTALREVGVGDGMTPYETDKGIIAARITIIVDGRSPLLTHNPASMGTVSEAAKGSRIPEAEVEAEAGCYRTPDGVLAIRGDSFRSSILKAAGQWKSKRGTMKSRLAHIVVLEDLIPLMRRDGTLITEYVIDARRAVIQRQGIIRRRPKFEEWSCKFTVEFDPLLVTDPKMICQIAEDAGGRIGVGDFRPEKNGWFGRYTVRSYRLED